MNDKDKQGINAVEDYIQEIKESSHFTKQWKLISKLHARDSEKLAEEQDKLIATKGTFLNILSPTKQTINTKSGYSKSSINRIEWQEKHKDLWNAIKKGYDFIEQILSEELLWGNTGKAIPIIFYLKSAYQWRENAITDESERVVINIGANNGKNKY